MDLPTLNSLLRVNGLTPQSAPANITDVLIRSGYKHDEIAQAMAILQGAPPVTSTSVPAAYVESIIERTRTISHLEGDTSIFRGRLSMLQFWFSIVVALVLYGLSFVLVEVTAIPAFSLISGISLFTPPDFATVPMAVVALFGIGMAMLVLPAIFFLIVFVGLQVRRCHDYGLSGPAWFMALFALSVSGYLLYDLTALASLAPVVAFILWLALMSWPRTKGDNQYGGTEAYPSVWAALRGSFDESGNLPSFLKRYLLPLLYFEVAGIILCFCIHTLAPRVHVPSLPQLNLPTVSTTSQI